MIIATCGVKRIVSALLYLQGGDGRCQQLPNLNATQLENYVIAVEYRFNGDQAIGGPDWATWNSGIMIHGQKP